MARKSHATDAVSEPGSDHLSPADQHALRSHAELRATEIVAWARQDGAKYGADPRALGEIVAKQVRDALDSADAA